MKKRLLSMALALLICGCLTLPAAAEYRDIPEGHWSAESVDRATELGLFQGIDEGVFGRGQPISRAAFVTAMVRLFGWEEVRPENPSFSDVTADRWFYGAVETALANGAIAASDAEFRPTDDVTREEMAAMLVRGLGYSSLAGAASSYDAPFSDITSNKGFLIVAYDLGIVEGIGDGLFHPDGTAAREQAAAMLVRVHDRLYDHSVPLSALGTYEPITVESPEASIDTNLPTTPLEPLTDLYDALRTCKDSGADMDRMALCLRGGGTRTVVSAGTVLSTDELNAQQVSSLLRIDGLNTYYSDRYESAYCIYRPNDFQVATVWYQSERSLEAKLQLARLFGVTRYYLT